jgi:hypothetical protein
MTEQRDARDLDAAQDDPVVSLQEDFASEHSRTLSLEELHAVAGGPTIDNGP